MNGGPGLRRLALWTGWAALAAVAVMLALVASAAMVAARAQSGPPACCLVPSQAPGPTPARGTAWSALRIETAAGPTTLHDAQRGQPVLLAFVATWCSKCALEAPRLVELANLGVDVLLVGVADSSSALSDWALQHAPALPSATLSRPAATAEVGVRSLPTLVLVDATGREARRWTGVVAADTVLQAWRELLARP